MGKKGQNRNETFKLTMTHWYAQNGYIFQLIPSMSGENVKRNKLNMK